MLLSSVTIIILNSFENVRGNQSATASSTGSGTLTKTESKDS